VSRRVVEKGRPVETGSGEGPACREGRKGSTGAEYGRGWFRTVGGLGMRGFSSVIGVGVAALEV
jgi:hypothetical protein